MKGMKIHALNVGKAALAIFLILTIAVLLDVLDFVSADSDTQLNTTNNSTNTTSFDNTTNTHAFGFSFVTDVNVTRA